MRPPSVTKLTKHLALLLVAASCSKSDHSMARFYEDGRAKPAVAITSIIDSTSFDASWSLSEELTSMVVSRVSQGGSIYVASKDDLTYTENPFSGDLSWIKREFPGQEFVVFLELIEHENVPVCKHNQTPVAIPFETATSLKMAVRIRMVDLRGSTPKIVLQELVKDSYYIPKNTIPTDYNLATWGTEEYSRSPMGLAHKQLINEISTRISEYIQLAKSR